MIVYTCSLVTTTIRPETNSTGTTTVGGPCPQDYSQCTNGECKKTKYWCDTYLDCTDQSDECGCGMFYYFLYHALHAFKLFIDLVIGST